MNGRTSRRGLRVWLLGTVSVLALVVGILPVSAGSGSSTGYDDHGNNYTANYGSTEVSGSTALLNYVSVDVNISGMRIDSDVCVQYAVISQGNAISPLSSKSCRNFGPGIFAITAHWDLYQPSSPDQRLQLRRGNSRVVVEISSTQWGGAPDFNAADPSDPNNLQPGQVTGAYILSLPIS